MAQPTVSAQIRKLTETAGLPLFEQIGKQIYLTAAGHRMHAHCRKVFAALAELDDALAGLRGLSSGTLRVASGTPGQSLMPRLVAAFAAMHPGLDVTLRVHNRRDLMERLAANEDDLYVFANPPDDRELVRQADRVARARRDRARRRRAGPQARHHAGRTRRRVVHRARTRIRHTDARRAGVRGAGARPALPRRDDERRRDPRRHSRRTRRGDARARVRRRRRVGRARRRGISARADALLRLPGGSGAFVRRRSVPRPRPRHGRWVARRSRLECATSLDRPAIGAPARPSTSPS